MTQNTLIPTVLERTADGEISYDLYSRLAKDRVIFVNEEVSDQSISVALAELVYLNAISKTKPIHMHIISPGGSVHAGLALIDKMNFISAPVYTYCEGYAASMGAAILCSGEPGYRFAYPNSQTMFHQVGSGGQGKVHDLYVGTNYDKRLNSLLLAMIGKNCGKLSAEEYEIIHDNIEMLKDDDENVVLKLPKPLEKKLNAVKKEFDRDNWMMPSRALEYGAIDKIVKTEKELENYIRVKQEENTKTK